MEILGIDVGGTGIKAAIVNTETGELTSEKRRVKTPKSATPEAVANKIQKLINHFNWTEIVGCGFPTPLQHGKCLSGGNLHETWKGVLVNELFKNKTGNDFYIVNDADAAGLAEINFGAGKDKKGVVVMVTLGTGIGSAVFLDGKLLPNTEFGHVLHKSGIIFEKYTADSIRKSEKLTRKKWGKRLHEYFKHINLLLSPDLFIIGGGGGKRIGEFEKRIKIATPIVAAEAENEAGIIGAALAAKFQIK
jgi:polyphosphate glucokinase